VATELDRFDYALPPGCIAQHPAPERDAARLLVLERASGHLAHCHVRDLPELLRPDDLLVVNATRVVPAKLRGTKATGGAAEALLLGGAGADRHRALVRCRGRLRPGLKLHFGALDAEVVALHEGGEVLLAFPPGSDPYAEGETPLPPYIRRATPHPEDLTRYQTVFAREPGSVAAPTAGLHLTRHLLERLAASGVEYAEVVLHIGLGTFRPVGEAELAADALHPEPFELPEATAAAVARARERGGRVVAAGTTVTRLLESRARGGGLVEPGRGETRLFLRPERGSAAPRRFAAVDVLLTNFHLPRSSLLLLVSAFAGRRRVLDAYAEAIRAGYRFYSYGDAMLIA
jgi:S-adenosylmethionine:tRNA ribosyltransferase-isomerase